MPIYEYLCLTCQRPFQTLVLSSEEEEQVQCPDCGGKTLKRLISRVVYHASEQDRLAAYDPHKSPKDDAFYKDSRNIGLHAKKRAQQLGVDLGKSFEDKLERLRTDPSSVIKDSE